MNLNSYCRASDSINAWHGLNPNSSHTSHTCCASIARSNHLSACVHGLILVLAFGLFAAKTFAQTLPYVAPQSMPSQGVSQFIYRAKQGDTAESIAFEFLNEVHKKPNRDAFYALNRIQAKSARLPVNVNQPFNIPVAWMYAKPVLASVVSATGTAQMSHANTKNMLINIGTIDKKIEEGTTIKTGDNSFVGLRFPDNSALSVTPNSEVVIETMRQYAGSDVFIIKILLNKGRAESEVKPLVNQASEYSVRSRRLTTGVRGTQFNVNEDPNGNASAEVFDGGVKLAGSVGKALDVPVGFGSFVAQEKPSDLIPLLAAPVWACDSDGVNMSKPLPIVFVKKPAHYRVDIYSGQLGNQQLVQTLPQIPLDLPLGDYRISARGIDANGLQGYGASSAVSVKEIITPGFIRWVTVDAGQTWVQQETSAKTTKVYVCESS